VKAIVLSRLLGDAARKHCQEYLALEDVQETSKDIRHYVEDFIQHRSNLRQLKESEKSEIIQKYVESANRSFLWAELQLQVIKHEDSASAILKACQKAPTTVDECVARLIGKLDVKRAETKRILSWVLAAERPLSLKELKALVEVDLDGYAYRPFLGDVEKLVRQLCGPLLVIQDNLVYLRHPSIRERLLSTTSNKSASLVINLNNAHEELATRSMAYVKIHLLQYEDLGPQLDFCSGKEMSRSFGQHALLEYAVRYWLLHFRSSSLYDKSRNKVSFSDRFKMSFPGSVRLALYEGTCLARQYISVEAESYQNLALTIRKSLAQDRPAALLQSVLMEIRIGSGFKDAHVLSGYSYEAYKLGVHVCSDIMVQALAEAFISYSANLKVSGHTELVEEKVDVLQYIIELYEHEHVESKQIVYLGFLAQLYLDIKETQKAVVIYRKLYRLRLRACGHLHEETRTLFHFFVSYLKQLALYNEVLEVTLEYHEYVEQTLAITDQRHIDSTLVVVQIYEERKEYFKAEQTLVRYWKSVSCAKVSSRITELRVEFALKYADFLHRYSRKEECQIVLRGVWTEIQSYSYEYRFQSTMITRVETIAEYCAKLEIFSISRSIYQSLYEYYENREERTSTECIKIVRSLAETITKSFSCSATISSSTSTRSTRSTTTTVITKEEKSTLLKIFESSLETTEISSTTIAICQALCSSYLYEEKYEEACEIYSRVISKVWAAITSVSLSIDITEITEHLTLEILDLCISFADCHFKMLHIEIAETIYINIFRALICIRHIDRRFIFEKIKLIIAFFEMTYKFERVIEIYRELFIWCPIMFGKTHSETIIILMAFARVCFRLRLYDEASTACFFVYTCFRNARGCLHIDGVAAAILLAEIYEIQCKWHLAYEVYGYLWRTFLRYGAEYRIEAAIIQKIYERYIFILEHKESWEISMLVEISKEYHHHCVSLYKHHHKVSIKATLAYAHYCERMEEHHELSVSLYQQVIKYCKMNQTEFSRKTIHTCNTRVAKLYASSVKEIAKAVEIYHEEFESCKKSSKTSTETMNALHSYVSTCRKQSTTESVTKATETMRWSVLEIFKEESSTETLVTSARNIAKIYKECNFTEEALSLVVEMRSKIVDEVRTSVTSRTDFSHSSYAFLASFQEAISESCSFSSAMAEIRVEVMLYQSYFEATKTQTDYGAVIKSGSSLYLHLQSKKECHSEFVKIKTELTEYFSKYLALGRTVRGLSWTTFFTYT
jgi:tetratricopeptide (TPR) repeat protein